MGKGIIHSDTTKIRCAYLYASLGNYSQVARDTKIKRVSIMNWARDSSVWDEALTKAKQEQSDELLAQHMESARLSGIELQDRIVNGDHKLTKGGTTVRMPMSGRDLAVVNGIQVDKGRVNMGMATSIRGDSQSMQSMIDRFEQIERDHQQIKSSVVSTQHKGQSST